jgi:hypothetical protein
VETHGEITRKVWRGRFAPAAAAAQTVGTPAERIAGLG